MVRGKRPDIRWIKEQPFAHRGLFCPKRGVPENSLAAFDAAIAESIGIELDVRLSGDGVPMVFHDEDLTRLCERSEKLSDLHSDRLIDISLAQSDQKIPRLSEVLNLVQGRVPILIEMKFQDGLGDRLEVGVRRALEGYQGPLGVMSFHSQMLDWFKRIAPGYARGLVISCSKGVGQAPAAFRGPMALRRIRSRADFLACDVRCLPMRTAQKARASDVPVIAWTIRSVQDGETAGNHADTIIFERPSCQSE